MNNLMTCTTCKALVQLNATGICLGCQGGFNPFNDEDKYVPVETQLQSKEEEITRLKAREKELEDAIQKQSTKEIHVQPEARTCQRVRRSNTKGKETPPKIKEEKTKEGINESKMDTSRG